MGNLLYERAQVYDIGEISGTFERCPVFIEYRDRPENNCWAFFLYEKQPFLAFATATSSINGYIPDYGKTWRCWDEEPDADAKEAEAWRST